MKVIGRKLGLTLALAGVLSAPLAVRGADDLDFSGVEAVNTGEIRGQELLPALGFAERPMLLVGSLGRVLEAAERGEPMLPQDVEIVRTAVDASRIALRESVETVDGDLSTDALLDEVIPPLGAETVEASGTDPRVMREVTSRLQALHDDLFALDFAESLGSLGGRPYSRFGGAGADGGLSSRQQSQLRQGYIPTLRTRIAENARTLQGILQSG